MRKLLLPLELPLQVAEARVLPLHWGLWLRQVWVGHRWAEPRLLLLLMMVVVGMQMGR